MPTAMTFRDLYAERIDAEQERIDAAQLARATEEGARREDALTIIAAICDGSVPLPEYPDVSSYANWHVRRLAEVAGADRLGDFGQSGGWYHTSEDRWTVRIGDREATLVAHFNPRGRSFPELRWTA